ncbi:MAG: ABC transporter ATP-binding protein [Myxococcota bacterium]|nr:ABC transporter ATP-binding protein [Myxococcota bacterium]
MNVVESASSQPAPIAFSRAAEKGVLLKGVGKKYPGPGGVLVEALRHIDLAMVPGEFVCLIGASGCGKSTLLRIIGGFERATSGEVTVGGRPVRRPGPDRGFVFQDYGLFPWLTVHDNIAYGPTQRHMSREQVTATTARFLSLVGLERFAGQYPHQLSGGMQQRVGIARVLANDPAVLLMDEPFGALDSLTRQTMQDELRRIWQELRPVVVLVTHSVEEAVYLADRVVVIKGGASHGTPGAIARTLSIPLDHPRDVTGPEFNALKRELLSVIHGP